jgi:peptidoglycan L-alanyl-D-glutamate endopeptidase CwlK
MLITDVNNALSRKRILTLHPMIRQAAIDAVCEVQTHNIGMLVTYGLRTFAEQDALFAKVPKVTKARGGQSYHNYGLALDFCLMIGNKASWNMAIDTNGSGYSDWLEIVTIFKMHGFEWGGDWQSFKDNPHLQMLFNYHWKQLLALHDQGKVDENGYVIIQGSQF